MRKIVVLLAVFLLGLCFAWGNQPGLEKIEMDLNGEIDASFYIIEISDELFAKMQGKSFKADCTIPRSELRYLHVLHKTLDGATLEGELVCNVKIADVLLGIFKDLYAAGYPIEKLRLVDEYDADDERSMSDNNSSCFNFKYRSQFVCKKPRPIECIIFVFAHFRWNLV